MKSQIERLPNKTYKIKVTVEKDTVDKAFNDVVREFAKEAKIEGFRKGKAPISLVKEKIDKGKLNGEVINLLIPKYYAQVIKEHHLKPISTPKIELNQFETGKDLVFTVTVAEKPDIKLGDYKKALKDLGKNFRPKTIYGPDGTEIKGKKNKTPSVEDIVNAVLNVSEIEIPDLLIQEEVNRMMSSLIDQVSRLGMTIEDYLKANNKTIEEIKGTYTKSAKFNIKAEFILNEIAKDLNIDVSEEEIQKTIDAAPDEESRKMLSQDDKKWYIKNVLRKNKTIQKLINIAL